MAKGFKMGGGGGAPLNFKVVGGTKPSNPKENTILVSNPNLLDFSAWANSVEVVNGSKVVSGNAIHLTSDGNGDCYTMFYGEGTIMIPCTPGKTYVMEWEHSGDAGYVYFFGTSGQMVNAHSSYGKLEYIPGEGETQFAFRFGVSDPNVTATYSNIRITEKMAEITGWHFDAEEPNVYDIKTNAEDPHQYYAPHVLSNGDILNFVIPQTCTAFDWVRFNGIDGKTYAIRYADGSLFTSWNAGVKVGVLISNEKTVMGGAEVFLAKLLTYGSFYHREGTVWIQTGTTSTVEMNVLKKNSIQVCPLTAKQYVGGAWALKDAETYQGGKWNDWAYWIIGNGADGLGITGGFTSNYENQWSFADDGSLTFYKDIDNMYSSFNVPSKRTFDVTNYNSMTIKVSSFSRNASYIGVNAPSNLGKDSTCRVKISAAGTYTLDISAISGEVHLQADLDYNGVTMVVSELYFS